MLKLALLLALVLLPALPASAQPYEGFGTQTPGGAGHPVVRVTTLADSGPGSLREALSAGHRTIVFDVAGDIVLADHLWVRGAFVTIDGFSAPSPGITLRNRGLILRGTRGAHDVIVRGIRVRDASIDGIQVSYGAYNIVIDHVSIDGSADGNLDITDSTDVTVSWSILSGAQNMLVKYGPARITLHHNVFVNGPSRNPQVRIDDAGSVATETTVDMRNNAIASWKSYGTLVWQGPWANVVGNWYRHGKSALDVLSAQAYTAGNVSGDGAELNAVGTSTVPFPAPAVTTTDACTAAAQVLEQAGVRPLDTLDQQRLATITLQGC